ncbi:MAG: hypothetical protein UV73_C0007G0037 [Candidatus Gottesmanbacteria bacterium GW2011_GWA2_43_14]|uniref:Uncharacterized protein n=1 Tax=Candidatus Gottesmanbacteria bacterium GW2011_GWA2_43_14 TaxID=1618443 RepID=A0A0G1DIV3_9BACT|nr:MAG: hypothetical protein UV73_C0007G0037 [Candidatus Gottesmanbacteria bacterium GW2011_GWA2_43_14]
MTDNTDNPDLPESVSPDEIPGQDASVMLNLEQLVKNHLTQIEQTKDKLKKHREMLDDIFLNDPTYQEHDKKAKEAVKVKSATRSELLKRTDVADLNNKVKEMKISVKELQEALNEYVREYQRLSGVNEITDDKGNVMEIVYTVKLVRKSSKKS